MSKLVKKMQLEAMTKTFGKARDLVFLRTNKVDSGLEYNFRKLLRDKKVHLQMVKNTFARKILLENGIEVKGVWEGNTYIAWGTDSIKQLSQAVDGVLKEIEKKDNKVKDKIIVKSAVADGQQVTMKQALEMPTRQEILGQVIGMLFSPVSAVIGAVISPAGQVVSQLDKLIENKEKEGQAPSTSV